MSPVFHEHGVCLGRLPLVGLGLFDVGADENVQLSADTFSGSPAVWYNNSQLTLLEGD